MGSIIWKFVASGAVGLVWGLLLVRRLREPSRRRHRPKKRTGQGPVWMSIIGWLLIAVVVATASGAGLLWLLGWPKMPTQSSFTTAEMLDLLKIGLAVVAGFGGVVALAVNYRKQRTTEAAHALTLSQEERELTKLFNERFKVAAEQLSSDQVGLRIAGVYAMAGLADDWKAQRQTCVDALIAYLRLLKDDSDWEVVNAIFRLLRDRLGTHLRAGSWSTLNFDFTGVRFREADFSELTFEGEVIFDGAEFVGDNTSFERTAFRNTVLSCHGTKFTDTRANFQDAFFDASGVQFVGCEFERTEINLRGIEAAGRSIYFYRSKFDNSSLIGRDAALGTGAIRIEFCTLTNTRVDMTDVQGASSDSRSLGFLFIVGSTMRGGILSVRPLDPDYQWVWLRDSTFEDVQILTGEEAPEWLKIRGGEQEELPTT